MGESERLSELRERIEQLTLLEVVAEKRQEQLEALLDEAIAAGIDAETIRTRLGLSEESLEKLLNGASPDLHERLGISRATAERLEENATSSS